MGWVTQVKQDGALIYLIGPDPLQGKMTPRSKNILLRPHMIRIAHTELPAMNRPARTPRPCPDDRLRAATVPHACSVCASVGPAHLLCVRHVARAVPHASTQSRIR